MEISTWFTEARYMVRPTAWNRACGDSRAALFQLHEMRRVGHSVVEPEANELAAIVAEMDRLLQRS